MNLNRATLVEQITQDLRARIATAELKPGQRLAEEALANDLGVSRTPVREALRRLAYDGWVTVERRIGATVAPLTEAEVKDLSLVRLVLEPTAARMSLGLNRDIVSSQLNSALVRQQDCVNDADAFAASNTDFHFALYGLTIDDNDFTRTIRSNWDRAIRFRTDHWSRKENIVHSWHEHEAIFEAWCQQDADALEKLLFDHIAHVLQAHAEHYNINLDEDARFKALSEKYQY